MGLPATTVDDDVGVGPGALLLAASADEMATARWLVGIASGLSLTASLSMVAGFVVFQESRRCGRRILLCLHVADAGAAIAWLLTLWLPREREPPTTPPPLCLAQGYLLVFFSFSSYLWSACFACHLFQILARRAKYPELYERRYHILAWGIPASTIVQLALQHIGGYTLIGESGRPWCWFRSWSDFEWSEEGFHVQLGLFYVPVLLVFLHNLGTYIALLYQVTDLISTKVEERIWRRMMAYTWVFFLSFIWGLFAFLYQAFAEDHELSPVMLYFMSFFTPLQGAMNAVVYGLNTKFRQRTRDLVLGQFRK